MGYELSFHVGADDDDGGCIIHDMGEGQLIISQTLPPEFGGTEVRITFPAHRMEETLSRLAARYTH